MHPRRRRPWVNQLIVFQNLVFKQSSIPLRINVHLVVFSKVIYLWSKVVSFVLFVTLSSPKPWPFMSCSWYLWKALSMNRGAWRIMSCSWYLWKALSMNRDAWRFMLCSWYLWKALSMSRGGVTWFETVWSLRCESYWLFHHFLNEN